MTAFKTIHECRLELIASTQLEPKEMRDPEFGGCYERGDSDTLPVSAARASFGKEDKTGEDPEKDLKLMNYLAAHEHLTPFEYQHATFLVEVPLFIRSQIMRHRTFSYNEISRRYTSENLEFWIPDKVRAQSKSNKQASTDEEILVIPGYPATEFDPLGQRDIPTSEVFEWCASSSLTMYNKLVGSGVCREQARAVLPQSLLTRFYMGGNLRNWAHFIRLRKDEHAQYEVRVVAERIEKELRTLWPSSVSALLGE